MSPSSEEIRGHTGQELRVSLKLLSLTVLRFVVAHRRPPEYATCTYLAHFFIAGTPSDARFEVVGKFLTSIDTTCTFVIGTYYLGICSGVTARASGMQLHCWYDIRYPLKTNTGT